MPFPLEDEWPRRLAIFQRRHGLLHRVNEGRFLK
jgi:hypothetical protein